MDHTIKHMSHGTVMSKPFYEKGTLIIHWQENAMHGGKPVIYTSIDKESLKVQDISSIQPGQNVASVRNANDVPLIFQVNGITLINRMDI